MQPLLSCCLLHLPSLVRITQVLPLMLFCILHVQSSSPVAVPELQLPQDCQKLKRHIALFFERIQKRAKPAPSATRPLAALHQEEKAPAKLLPTVEEETDL